MKRSGWVKAVLVALLGSVPAMVACKSGGVGDPCIPEDEYQPGFSGFSIDEVNVESRSFQCETRVCLVNHFQGRVSCPYGQDESYVCKTYGTAEQKEDSACPPGTDASTVTLPDEAGGALSEKYGAPQTPQSSVAACRIPGENGLVDVEGDDLGQEVIHVPVEAQNSERQADDSVYCSCRCAGPDPNARYCDCPSGFSCEELVKDLGLGSGQLAGSYCIKNGTRYDSSQRGGQVCVPGAGADDTGYCGNDGKNP
jgi:hypothetical protein